MEKKMTTPLELFSERDKLKAQIKTLQDNLKSVENELELTYVDRAKELLANQRKDFGTVSILDGNIEIKATVSKKVEWDQESLMGVLNRMSVEDASHYGKIAVTVEERKYTAAPMYIRQQLEPCRTTSVGKMTISIKGDDNNGA
tara:strand:- start:643 stop:1074 length:432 start_codon:yes stop_codon:yes gene_type:complete